MTETPNINFALNFLPRPDEADDLKANVETAFRTIASVHKLPFAHALNVTTSLPPADAPDGVAGWYSPRERNNINVNPLVAEDGKLVIPVIVHEFAHLLDNEFFGAKYRGLATENKEAMEGNPELDMLMFLLWMTKPIQHLLRGVPMPDPSGRPGMYVSPGDGTPGDELRTRAYLSSRGETFARAYMQWVGVRSGQSDVVEMFKQHLADNPFEFWGEEEFTPIADAFDQLFEKSGLLVTPRTFSVDGTGRVSEAVAARD